MKKSTIIGLSIVVFSASLVGCNTMRTVNNTGNSVVNTSAGVVSGVGHATVNTVNGGVNVLTGHSNRHTVSNVNGKRYHNGHVYR